MKSDEEEKLKEEYRQAAHEEGGNSFDANCEVRLVLDKTPHDGVRVLGAWVQCWRFIEGNHWLGEEDVEDTAKPETPAVIVTDEQLSPDQLADRWKVSKATIRKLRKLGKLPFLGITPALFRIRMVDVLRIEWEGKLLPSISPRRKANPKTSKK
jgi:hypothetical protein